MKKGDFVRIEFVGRIKNTGEIFDLTDEDLAKKEGIYNQESSYGPSLVIIGSGNVIEGVEEKLKKMKVGEKKEFDVPNEKAFGKRNPKLVKIISITKFIQNKINPVPGTYVNIDGANCKIQSVSGGRVRVDFNNPLAGKDLHYELKIIEKIDGGKNKLESLLKNYKIEAETKVTATKAEIKLKQPNPRIQSMIEKMVKEWIPEIKTISFVE